MAKYLLEEVCPSILEGSGAVATRVRIWETDESYAEASVSLQEDAISTIYQSAIAGD
jgi:6-pyruvoyltetrahydropterin/6-carboxytetrahydropterin synthase